jgi:hypothetical protein
MFFYSRVLPASGAIPKPGQDISETAPWQQHMRRGEIALFCFDAKSGQLLTAKGERPQLPLQEHCMIFGSLYAARHTARAQVTSKPLMLCALYGKRGRWLATMSREGEVRRNPGLGLAWLLLQFPLLALFGTPVLLAVSDLFARYLKTDPIRWRQMSPQELYGMITGGMLLGIAGRLLFDHGRRRLIAWHAQPALAAIGSPGREKLYRRMAKTAAPGLLVPLNITLVPTEIEWPSPETYNEWTLVLRNKGFQHFGQYLAPEVKISLDFWFNDQHDLTASISFLPTQGMWLSVFTRYEDGSSFAVANKVPTGLDQHSRRQIIYLGPDATADAVVEQALHNRPDGLRRRPTVENLLEDYTAAWRTHVAWRRERGTTPEEYKRVSERRALAKGSA